MIVKINVENLYISMRFLGVLMVLYGAIDLYITQSLILDLIIIPLGLMLILAHQRLDINLDKKQYQSYYWALGLKLQNEGGVLKEITSVVCIQGKFNQQYGKYNRRFISGVLYKGYIEVKDQESLFVGQHKSKPSLLKKLTKISADLKVPVVDRTSEED